MGVAIHNIGDRHGTWVIVAKTREWRTSSYTVWEVCDCGAIRKSLAATRLLGARCGKCSRKPKSDRGLTAGGVTRFVSEWARRLGTSDQTVWNRLNAGWPPEKAVTVPVGSYWRYPGPRVVQRNTTPDARGLERKAVGHRSSGR